MCLDCGYYTSEGPKVHMWFKSPYPTKKRITELQGYYHGSMSESAWGCFARIFLVKGCGARDSILTLTPRYLLFRVLEPLGPYIVGTWRVRVRFRDWRSQVSFVRCFCLFRVQGLG